MAIKRLVIACMLLSLLLTVMAACGTQAPAADTSASSATSASMVAGESEEAPLEMDASEPDAVPFDTEADDSEEAPAESTDDEALTAYFPLEDNETISMWTAYPPLGFTPEDYLIFNEAQQRLNITLDFSASSLLTAGDDFSLMIASNDYPDILNYFSNFYNGSITNAYEQEIVLDLTDIIDEYGPDYQAARTANDTLTEQTLDDDMILSFYMIHGGEYAAGFGPVVRQDWLDEQGLEAPVTYDDWHDVAAAFKEAYGATIAMPPTGTNGEYLSSGYDITLHNADSNSSAGFFRKDGKVCYGAYSDGFRDYLEMMRQWYEEGLIYPDFYSGTNGNSTEAGLITSNTVGIFWISSPYINEYENQMNASGIMLPMADAVKTPDQVTHMRSNTNEPMACTVISTGCENVELAVRFMNWWYTEEGSVLANYDVEGETFNYGENGEILWTELITENTEYPLDGALALYTASRDSIPYVYDDGKYDTLYSEIQIAAGKVWRCNDDGAYVMPSSFDPSADEDALTLMSDIFTYVSQCTLQFIVGDKDLSEFDTYRQQLKSMGIEDVLDAYTAQCAQYD